MWGKIKAAGAFLCGLFGILASLASILGYLEIRPLDAAAGLERLFLMSAPLLTFLCGALSGWGFTKRWADRKLAAREAEADLAASRHDAELERIKSEHALETERIMAEHAGKKADGSAREAKDPQDAACREQRGQRISEPSISALIPIGQYYAAGVLDALRRTDAGERYIGFGENVEASLDLIKHSNGIIARVETSFMGHRSSEDKYYVTSEWAAFLALPDNRRALEKLAGDAWWPK